MRKYLVFVVFKQTNKQNYLAVNITLKGVNIINGINAEKENNEKKMHGYQNEVVSLIELLLEIYGKQ